MWSIRRICKKALYSQPAQPQTDNFQDMQTVELEKDFDNSFNIMEDDIQF